MASPPSSVTKVNPQLNSSKKEVSTEGKCFQYSPKSACGLLYKLLQMACNQRNAVSLAANGGGLFAAKVDFLFAANVDGLFVERCRCKSSLMPHTPSALERLFQMLLKLFHARLEV